MRFILTPYTIVLVVTAAASVAVMAVIWRRRGMPEARVLLLLLLAGTEWALAGGFEAAAVGQAAKIIFSKLGYFGFTVMPPLVVLFAFERGSDAKKLSTAFRIFLFAPTVITVVLSSTNELHGLIWSGFTPGPPGSNSIIYNHGPAYWIMTVISLSYLLAALWRFTISAWRSRGLFHFQGLILAFAALFPIIGAALYLIPSPLFPGLDMVLIGFMFACFCLAAGVLRFRLFDLVPIAREKIVENMSDGVVVLDRDYRIVDANPASRLFSSSADRIPPGTPMTDRFPWWKGVRDLASGEQRIEVLELEGYRTPVRAAELTVTSLRDNRRGIMGWLITLHDITKRRGAERDLVNALHNLEALNGKHVQDLALARKIQQSLLPESKLRFRGVSVSCAYAPCDELGGDIVGVFPVDDAHIAIYIGDVSGHGVYAAMVMSYVKKLIETSVKRVYIKQRFIVKPPGAVLTTVNKNFIAEISFGNPEVFLTLFLGVLDVRDLSFEFSSAGIHIPPFQISGRSVSELFEVSDLPIGYDPEHQYETSRTRLSAGDILLFVTDGVVDARRDELRYGSQRLREEALRILGDGNELDTEEILSSVRRFLDGGILEDDMCMLSIALDSAGDRDRQVSGPPTLEYNGIKENP